MTLGRVSRTAEHKGYERLIRNFAVIAAKCPNCKLIIAGDGDLLASLRRLARELEIESSVYFPGNIHEDDLSDLYRSATIFSLVSDRGSGEVKVFPLRRWKQWHVVFLLLSVIRMVRQNASRIVETGLSWIHSMPVGMSG